MLLADRTPQTLTHNVCEARIFSPHHAHTKARALTHVSHPRPPSPNPIPKPLFPSISLIASLTPTPLQLNPLRYSSTPNAQSNQPLHCTTVNRPPSTLYNTQQSNRPPPLQLSLPLLPDPHALTPRFPNPPSQKRTLYSPHANWPPSSKPPLPPPKPTPPFKSALPQHTIPSTSTFYDNPSIQPPIQSFPLNLQTEYHAIHAIHTIPSMLSIPYTPTYHPSIHPSIPSIKFHPHTTSSIPSIPYQYTIHTIHSSIPYQA